MAATVEKYNTTAAILLAVGTTANLKVMLVSSAYAFDAAHAALADVSAHEIVGTGYTAGGSAVAGLAASVIDGVDPDGAKLDADDVVFSNLTATFRRAIVYVDATVGGVVQPLLLSYLLDDTPADVALTGTNYKLTIDEEGLIKAAWL